MAEQVNLTRKWEFSAGIEDALISLCVDDSVSGVNSLAELTLHTHVCYEVFVCLRGTIILETEYGNIILNAFDAAIVPPRLSHHKLSGTKDEDVQWAGLSFELKRRERIQGGKLYQELLEHGTGDRVLVFRKVSAFCNGIYELTRENHRSEDILPVLKLTQLLLELIRREAPVTDWMDYGSSERKRISLLEDLVNGHFTEPLTPAAVAEAMHISQRQLSRIVQKRYGITFAKMIQKKRLDTAARLLVSTNSAVETIGREVGFTAKTAFYRTFQNYYGMTPAAYRASYRDEK